MHSLHGLGCPAPSHSLFIKGLPTQNLMPHQTTLFFATFSASLVGDQWQSSLPGGPVPWLSAIFCTRLPAITASHKNSRSAPAAHTLGGASPSWTNPPLSPSHGTHCKLALGADGRQGYPATLRKNGNIQKQMQSRNGFPSQALMQPAQPTSLSGLLLFT